MISDTKALARARTILDERRRGNGEELDRRTKEVYAGHPKIRELDNKIRAALADACLEALGRGSDSETAVRDVGRKSLALQRERERALIDAGYPPKYLDEIVDCELCADTGYVGGKACDCLMQIYKKERISALSNILKTGAESFDDFDLTYYSDTVSTKKGISARASMELVLEICRTYAEKFGKNSNNLYFYGATGLGKTYLSGMVARTVASAGFSVVYETISAVFTKFEEDKFQKGEDVGAAREDIRRYLECDLLILDDLGTEMKNAFTQSVLYEIINTRLMRGGKTIISSNLTPEDISLCYSEQIASRINGEYHVLRFSGEDIRLLKKQNFTKTGRGAVHGK